MGAIIISPEAVWSYYLDHRSELKGQDKLIANNPEYGIDIYIAAYTSGILTICVTADGSPVYEEDVCDATECTSAVQMLYENYLSYSALNVLDELYSGIEDQIDEDKPSDEEIEIVRREAELDDAVLEFLENAMDRSVPYKDNLNDILSDLKEHFLEYMWKKHKIPIYRPMFLVDENNEEFYEDYPYECMVFEE